MCLCAFCHVLCLDLYLYMFICLDPYSTMSLHWISICLCACFYAYMSRSMFSHAYVFGSTFSTCFFLYSMCLCAPCHVQKPRPICLSCHVLLSPFCCFIFLSCILAYWFRSDLDPLVFVIGHAPWLISKGLDHPYLHVYACLLASMLYACISLSCSRLCDAWCP